MPVATGHRSPVDEYGRSDLVARDLEALGPAFVKLGQLLSSRVDLSDDADRRAWRGGRPDRRPHDGHDRHRQRRPATHLQAMVGKALLNLDGIARSSIPLSRRPKPWRPRSSARRCSPGSGGGSRIMGYPAVAFVLFLGRRLVRRVAGC
jgi:hypothetical protein